MAVQFRWAQALFAEKEANLGEVHTEDNRRDLGTKFLHQAHIKHWRRLIWLELLAGTRSMPLESAA